MFFESAIAVCTKTSIVLAKPEAELPTHGREGPTSNGDFLKYKSYGRCSSLHMDATLLPPNSITTAEAPIPHLDFQLESLQPA